MVNYELMAIINPSLTEDEINSVIENLKSILEKYEVKIDMEDILGEKKLAYKINKSSVGYYILLDLELDGKKIKDISKEINLNKNIWRYMFVKKED